jgi:hypothetical protein
MSNGLPPEAGLAAAGFGLALLLPGSGAWPWRFPKTPSGLAAPSAPIATVAQRRWAVRALHPVATVSSASGRRT